MGLNFPNAPTTGQLYPQPPINNVPVYQWDGAKWVVLIGQTSPVYIGDTPPSNPPQGTLWWNSANGNLNCYYNDGDSSQWVGTAPLSGSSGAVIGSVVWVTTTRVPVNHLIADGSSQLRANFPALAGALIFSGTVTFTASSAVIAWTAHGMSAGDKVKFFTAGTMPTGITAGTHGYNVGTEYFVSATGLTANAFEISATPGGAVITPSTAGSGVITAVNAPWGDGDGSTTFTLPPLRGDFIRAWDGGAGIDVNRGFGVEQLDAMQGHTHPNGYNPSVGLASGSYPYGGVQNCGNPSSDGVNGTPRTAAETRPRNQTLLPCIRYQ